MPISTPVPTVMNLWHLVYNWTTEDRESGQQAHYFHCDQIGIPREMTDKDSNSLWIGNYTAWGRLKKMSEFTSMRTSRSDCRTNTSMKRRGLHYNLFRYYEPEAGRFVNQDPIGLLNGENLYSFALNVQRSNDPKGLAVFAIPLIAPELIVLSKAALVTLGIDIIYEKGEKSS